MDRRNAIKTVSGITVGAAALLAGSKQAMAANATVNTSSEISRNHGHAVTMSAGDVILGLRDNGIENLSIKGRSGHDHTLSLTPAELMTLISSGEISVNSSTDAGHNHTVSITLA